MNKKMSKRLAAAAGMELKMIGQTVETRPSKKSMTLGYILRNTRRLSLASDYVDAKGEFSCGGIHTDAKEGRVIDRIAPHKVVLDEIHT